MGGFIILVAFAILGIFISRTAKANQQKTQDKHFDENFPFPTMLETTDNKPFDHWNMTLSDDLAPIAPAADEMVVDEVESTTTYRSIDMSDRSTDEMTCQTNKHEAFDFDLRQAVIYSELLKPKFTE